MKKSMMKNLMSGLLLSLFASSAFATGYVGIEGGTARTNEFYDAMQSVANEVEADGGSASKGVRFARVFAGKQMNDNVSAELGIFKTSDFTGNIHISGYPNINTSVSVMGFDASVIGKHPSGVYAKAGLYHASAKGKGEIGGYKFYSGKESENDVLIGVGYEHAFTKNVSGHVGVTHYHKLFNTFTLGVKSTF